jgi:hypothetical protein
LKAARRILSQVDGTPRIGVRLCSMSIAAMLLSSLPDKTADMILDDVLLGA